VSFHPGQLVVCVNDDAFYGGWCVCGLRRGTVYTVRDTEECAGFYIPGVRLREIDRSICRNARHQFPVDFPFGAFRFRPIDETRLAVFRQALTPVPTKETVS
jgi:hypothetical protein